jgi:predicted metal-dependent hydrolase
MTASSKETAHPGFALGMRLHNEGAFYDAHEAWEELWIDERDDGYRLFLQGLIQVTSAFHKVFFQKQPASAARLLARGLEKLSTYAGDYRGLALDSFRRQTKACADRLAVGAAIERQEVPRLQWVEEASEPKGVRSS